MKKKYVFLRVDTNAMFFRYMNKIDRYDYYFISNKKVIFKIISKIGLLNIIFGKWKHCVKKYDVFILGENNYTNKISSYIKKKNPSAKIIMFYMNTLNNYYMKILNDENIDEFWTFDKADSKKFNLMYNTQFYSNEIRLKDSKILFDILYLGRNKGRKQRLSDIKKVFDANNLKCNFNIIDSEKDYVDYDEYLDLVSKTKCIFDYNIEGQIGLSLRPLEALFFKKKLITNNKDIKKYDFYNKDNIFVIGDDDYKDLKSFLDKPFHIIDEKIMNFYDYKEWINRFEVMK